MSRKRGLGKAIIRQALQERLTKVENKIRKAIKRQSASTDIYALSMRMNNLRQELFHLNKI